MAADVTIDCAKTYAVSTYKGGGVTVTNLTASNSLGSALHVNSSQLTVNGAKITDTAAHGALANYGGTLMLSDVTMDGVGNNGVYVDGVTGETNVELTRLTLSDVGESGVYVNGEDGQADIDTLTVLKSEGAQSSVKRGIYCIGGTVTAKDVAISDAASYGVQSEVYVDDAGAATQGSVSVEKLLVTGTQGNAAVYSKNGQLTVTDATLSDSQKDGALVNNGGTLNLTDVEFNGVARHGIYVDGVSGGSVSNLSEISITNAGFHGVFINGADAKAYVNGLSVTTTNTYTLDEDAEYGDIRVSAGAYAEVEATTITGSKEHGLYVDADSELHLTGINSIENTGKYGVFANGANARIFINVQDGATKETDKLSVTDAGERGIHNASGTIHAANVTVTTPGTYGVSTGNSGSVTVDNLIVDGGNQNTQPAVNSYNSVLTVTNSTIKNSKGIGARVTDGGELNLENVSITNSGTDGVYIAHAGSVANVSGVTVNVTTSGNGINVAGGTLNMSGISTITKAKTAGVYVAVNAAANINVHEDASAETDKLTISNGERGIYNVGGTVNAANVTVDTMSSYGVQSEYFETTKGSVTVTNLSVTKAVSGAYTKGSVLTVTGATITDSTVHGTLANFGGVLTLTDVTIDGTGSGKNAVNIDGNSGATEAYINNVTVTNVSNYGVLAYGADGYVEIDGLKVEKAEGDTSSAKRGLCNNGATIVANNVQIDSAEKYSVSSWPYTVNNVVKAKGTMTITNLTVTNSKETAVHVNNSTVTVDGAKITDTTKYGAVVYTGGVLNLVKAEIDGAANGIHMEGKNSTLNLSGVSSITNTTNGVYVSVNSIANINVQEGASATADKLAITNTACGIYNVGGTVNAANVTVTEPETYGVYTVAHINAETNAVTKGSVTVANLSVTGAKCAVTAGEGATDAEKATADAAAAVCADNSTLTVTGGSAISDSAKSGASAVNGGTLNISGVTICDPGVYGVYAYGVNSDATVRITGINSISGIGKHGVFANGANAKVFINVEGTENASMDKTANTLSIANTGERGIHSDKGTIKAANVTITDPGTYGVSTGGNSTTPGSVSIDNLKVDGGNQNTQPAVNSYKSVLTVTNSTIENSKGVGARVTDGGALNLTNVTITNSATDAVYVNGEKGASKAYLTNVTVIKAGNYGVLAYSKDAYAEIDGLKVQAAEGENISSQRGLCNKGATVVAKNVQIDSAAKYSVSSWTYEDATGNTVKGTMTITGLTVTNSKETALHVNNSTVTVSGAKITTAEKYGAVVYTGGVLNLTKAEIDGTKNNGIHLEGRNSTLNLCGVSSIKNATTAGIYVAVNSVANINVQWNETDSKYTAMDAATNKLTVTNGERGIYNVGGTVNAANVTVNSASSYAAQTEISGSTKGSMTIYNLNVTQSSGNAAIYSKNSVLEVDGGIISNTNKDGALVNNGGKLTLKNVMVNNVGRYGILVDGDSGTKDAIAYLTNVTYESCKTANTKIYGTGTITVLD